MIPTAFDKTLSPEGTHIMSLFTQWVPADWSEEPHTAELEAYADRMIDCYNELAPNFKASILHRDIVGPYDMEQEYGLVGGNIFHGELSLEQLFHMRPAPGYADYRTPLRRPVLRQLGHARGRRGVRHPRLAGGPGGHRRPEGGQAVTERAPAHPAVMTTNPYPAERPTPRLPSAPYSPAPGCCNGAAAGGRGPAVAWRAPRRPHRTTPALPAAPPHHASPPGGPTAPRGPSRRPHRTTPALPAAPPHHAGPLGGPTAPHECFIQAVRTT